MATRQSAETATNCQIFLCSSSSLHSLNPGTGRLAHVGVGRLARTLWQLKRERASERGRDGERDIKMGTKNPERRVIKSAGSRRAADIHTGRVYIVGRFMPLMENVLLFAAANHFRASAGRVAGGPGWEVCVRGGGSPSLQSPK